jgi:hypothetical protein
VKIGNPSLDVGRGKVFSDWKCNGGDRITGGERQTNRRRQLKRRIGKKER